MARYRKLGEMVTFDVTKLEAPEKVREDVLTYCLSYGVEEGSLSQAPFKAIEKVLLKGVLSKPRDWHLYLPPVNHTDADRYRAMRQSVHERNKKVTEAKRLYLQVFHLNKGLLEMTPETVYEASKAVDVAQHSGRSEIMHHVHVNRG